MLIGTPIISYEKKMHLFDHLRTISILAKSTHKKHLDKKANALWNFYYYPLNVDVLCISWHEVNIHIFRWKNFSFELFTCIYIQATIGVFFSC